MNILLTGGTGFLGSFLSKELIAKRNNITIFTRKIPLNKIDSIKYITSLEDISGEFDVVINLAGESVDRIWNSKNKQKIYSSRIETTKKLLAALSKMEKKPKLLISASAIGYYGDSGDVPLDEKSIQSEESFSSKLCRDWEYEALKAGELGINTAIIRTGIVLDRNHGAFKKLAFNTKLFLGAQIGSGKQFMSWIHIEDYVKAVIYLISQNVPGIYNLTSPCPVTNSNFMKVLCKEMKRPYWVTLPSWLIKLVFGEMGENLLLKGQKVLPQKLLDLGFSFKYSMLDKAIENLIKDNSNNR